ncbi:Gfo/Idh/MocA family oxidoreductase [bacterium]|nr:Gfo/Idh/MocA family oxidoreductase [bacterium]
MAKKSPIKIGVIGLGRAGYNIHVHRLRGDDRFQITACTDFIPARMKEMRDEFGCETFKDVDAMLKGADAEVIVVATFSDTHTAVSKQVMKSGRAAICEKPIADSVADAKSLLATAEKTGQKLLVHHNYRFFPETRYLIELIKSQRIGEVFEIRMRALGFGRRYDWQCMRSHAGGVLNNTCPHFIDIGLQLLDSPVKEVFCDLKQIASFGDVEDHVKVLLRGENGRVYDMEVSSVCKFPEPKWTVLGSHGTLVSDGTTSKLAFFDPKKAGTYRLLTKPTPDRSYVTDEKIPWQEAEEPTKGKSIGDFYDNVHAVLRQGKPLVVAPEEALEVVRVTQECKKKSGYYR